MAESSHWNAFGAVPLVFGIELMGSAPARKQILWRTLLGIVLLFLIVGVDGMMRPTNWHHLFRREKWPGTDANALKKTVVSPSLEAEIAKGTNVLWCGTFQLAWNEVCDLTGGPLQFERSNPMIPALNKRAFGKDSLDDASYVAMAGFVRDNTCDKIRAAVTEKFHGSFAPRFIPDKALASRPQDIIAYACLYKNMSFVTPFERFDEKLIFGGAHVPAFGIGKFNPSLEKAYSQILILDYRDEDHFVIELKTSAPGDRLILAKVKPKSNLDDTIAFVASRITNSSSEFAGTNDLLLVPRMKIDVTRHYREIEKMRFIPKAANVAKDLILRAAVQNTRFEMNEKGVELIS